MLPNVESSSQPPPQNKGTVHVPILLNTVVVLVIYGLIAATNSEIGEIAGNTFLAMCILIIFNLAGLIITAVIGRTQTAIGLGFSILGIFLIGLGSCAESLKHLKIGH